MTTLTLEQRIDRLESRAAIAELGSAYAIACDERDLTRLGSLFDDNAVVRSLDGKMDAKGVDNIIAMFRSMFAIRGPAYHWTHDRFVFFDDQDPDRAAGQILAHAETTLNDVACLAALRYDDMYVRRDGVWLFAERVLSFLYYMPLRDYLERMPSAERFHDNGTYRMADYPEKLESWRQYYGQGQSA